MQENSRGAEGPVNELVAVLVSPGCYNKMPWLCGFSN